MKPQQGNLDPRHRVAVSLLVLVLMVQAFALKGESLWNEQHPSCIALRTRWLLPCYEN
jgi:hypothetical protein